MTPESQHDFVKYAQGGLAAQKKVDLSPDKLGRCSMSLPDLTTQELKMSESKLVKRAFSLDASNVQHMLISSIISISR